MKNLMIIIVIIAATMFVGCTKKTYEPLSQESLRDVLSEVKTTSRPSSPRTNNFVSPDGKLSIAIHTIFYSEQEESYVWFIVRKLNEAGEVVNERHLYSQKFSLANLAGKEYFYYIEDNCAVYYSLEDECIYFGQVFQKESPLSAYKIKYDLTNLELTPIKSINGYVEPVEIFLERD